MKTAHGRPAVPILLVFTLTFMIGAHAGAAPKAELWPRWEAHNPGNTAQLDHGAWAAFLKEYLVPGGPRKVNLVDYAAVTSQDKRKLDSYVQRLEDTDVSALSRPEQFAYWVNLYNAVTVQLILDHYPVDSIRDIKLGGLFSSGPWKEKLLEIEGESVSLDDVEHRILRPIWQDPRIHYAVNCASIGCPNLQPVPFTSDNAEELLNKGAKAYINSDRGVDDRNGRLFLSSIYDWFQQDFGGSEEGVITHLLEHADADTAAALRDRTGRIRYEYDWSLNDA